MEDTSAKGEVRFGDFKVAVLRKAKELLFIFICLLSGNCEKKNIQGCSDFDLVQPSKEILYTWLYQQVNDLVLLVIIIISNVNTLHYYLPSFHLI